ncbi:MAG: hypothetical protein ACE5EZ_04450 [Thermodesulfobacteriota bacterium]
MSKFFIGIIVGIIALICFIYFGGSDYVRSLGRHADKAAEQMETYEKKMRGFKERAGKVREKAEEAGKKIEKYIP